MRKSSESELRTLQELNARCLALIQTTSTTINYTMERVRKGTERVERVRAQGFGAVKFVLRPGPSPPSLVDAEVFDDPEAAATLNEIAGSCSCCGSRTQSLVALVRFESLGLDMALCGDCYQSLCERALGQVV